MEIKSINAKSFVIETLTNTKGYKEFSEIQKRVIPLALENKNIIGKSATGSGKTDAFLVPVFNKIDTNNDDLQAIIIAPTRELCAQIYQNAMDYVSNNSDIKVKLFTGGFERKKDLTSGNSIPAIPKFLKGSENFFQKVFREKKEEK